MMKKVFLAVAALLAVVSLEAQEPMQPGQNQTITLTLEQAIDIALSENPTIKIADMEIDRQDYARKETIANLIPSLSASGQYSYSIIKQTMSRDGLSFGADNTITLGANLNVPLFVPAVYANLKLNKLQIENAVEASRSSKINMVNEVKKSFYQILMLEESITVLRESEKLAQETVDNTKMLFESELASEYDLLTAEVSLNNILPNIIQSEGALEVSNMLLKILLSLPVEVNIDLLGSFPMYAETIAQEQIIYDTDVSGNTDIRTLEIQERLLKGQLKLINTQRMPTIAAFGQFSLYGNDMGEINFGGGGSEMPTLDPTQYDKLAPFFGLIGGQEGLNQFGSLLGSLMGGGGSSSSPAQKGLWWQTPASVGLSISIPIFTGGKTNSQAKQAKIAISQIQMQREYAERQMIAQAKNSITNISTAKGRMEANSKTVAQAQKAYDITNTRYNGGAGTILELNSAQLQLTQAQLNYNQAIYDYLAAQADYDKIIGRNFE